MIRVQDGVGRLTLGGSTLRHQLLPDFPEVFSDPVSRARTQYGTGSTTSLVPLFRLWTLRLLVKVGGHRKFIETSGYENDDLAASLGLPSLNGQDATAFATESIRQQLTKLLADAESGPNHNLPGAFERNIQRLSGLIGLEPLEQRLLAFGVALRVDQALHRASDYCGSFTKSQLEQALSTVLNVDPAQIRKALNPSNTLSRTSLLRVDTSQAYNMLMKLDLISSGFAETIFSSDSDPIELLGGRIVVAPPAKLSLADFDRIPQVASVLLPYVNAAIAQGRVGCNIILHGPPGSGKTQLVRALARACDSTELFEVATTDKAGEPISGNDRLRSWRIGQELLRSRPALLIFDEFSDAVGVPPPFGDAAAPCKGFMTRALEETTVPTFFVLNDISDLDPAYIRRADIVLEVGHMSNKRRRELIQATAGHLLSPTSVSLLSASKNLTPALLQRTTAVIDTVASTLSDTERDQAFRFLIGQTIKAQDGHGLESPACPMIAATYDSRFINADVDIQKLQEGLRRSGSGRLLLWGPPGTGKSAMARWLADELDMPLQVERPSTLLGGVVGQTEGQISEAFARASRENAVLVIDEADSFLQQRIGAQRSWEITQVNEMLVQIESFDTGILILSTNLMETLDSAILRRMDLKVHFDFLRPHQAVELLERYCQSLSLDTSDAARSLISSLSNLTPGDFAAVRRQADLCRPNTAEDFASLIERECSLKRQSTGRGIGFLT